MQNQKRLSGNTPILMVFIAFAIDLGQIALDAVGIGLVVNRLIDIGVLWFFRSWFKGHRIDFTGIRALIFYGLAFIEFIPVADAFPLWIVDVLAVIIMVNMEDRLKQSATQIVNNPATQRILKKGIMRTINMVGNRTPVLKSKIDAARRTKDEQTNLTNNRNESGQIRNINNTPSSNTERDNILKEQRNREPNATNQQ